MCAQRQDFNPRLPKNGPMDRDTLLIRISLIWLVILVIGCAYLLLA